MRRQNCLIVSLVSFLVASMLFPVGKAQAQVAAGAAGSSVGYIDDAIPTNMVRLRFDAAYNNRRPNRAEFFYAQGAPFGPGLAIPEKSVDYQEATAYVEFAPCERFSSFVEMPVRFINPDLNDNSAGYGDMNAGAKFAFIRTDDLVASVQFRCYVPTGDAGRGLGNDHVSLEPALLVYHRLSEELTIEAECRYWQPIGGTDFAGPIVRYGVGASYTVASFGSYHIRPVAEVVGWTVLDGYATTVSPFDIATVEDAEGDTIVNGKFGVRIVHDGSGDVYAGYGRALTGDRWYENVWRLELRLFF